MATERFKQIVNDEIEPQGIEQGWKNLKTYDMKTEDEKKAFHSMGGKASVRAKKERKSYREDILNILSRTDLTKELTKATNNQELIDIAERENLNLQEALIVSATLQALDGNMKAQDFLRDTVGEKPKENIEVSADIMTESDRKLLEKVQNRLEKGV